MRLMLMSITVVATAALSGVSSAADRAHPTVIELFQSQGCSSCPPANANVNAIVASRPDVLALNFSVTYWDRLGWKDTFGSPAFTARQWDYSNAAGRTNVSTPQVIVNGRGALVGSNRAQLDAAIRQYDRGPGGPPIGRDGNAVTVGAGKTPAPATVWLVQYDPRQLNVPIRAGENGGRTLPHRNIVRSLKALGSWTGPAARFVMPNGNPAYRSAILVQRGNGGAIVAAATIG